MRAAALVLFGLVAIATASLNYAGTIDVDIDREGADLPAMPMVLASTARAEDCQWYCTESVSCKSWSFESCGGARCWLKSEIKSQVKKSCRTSGVLTRADPSITITHGEPPKPTQHENITATKPVPRPTNIDNNSTKTKPVPRPTYTTAPTPAPSSCSYHNGNKFNATNFVSNFDFHTGADPVHGFVEYHDFTSASRWGLYKTIGNSVYIGVDKDNIKPKGRAAVRLTSKRSFGRGLLVADIAHMPGQACGLWPSLWTTGGNWPYEGEIDIIEYVNNNKANLMSLHTGPNCVMQRPTGSQFGIAEGSNCAVVAGGAGCGARAISEASIGNGFNKQGGGVYAMERTDKHIKIWFFPRGMSMPKSLLTDEPNPCEFGLPASYFPFSSSCSEDHFGSQRLIIGNTFCGDWADGKGNVYGNSGCPGKCTDFVANNPKAFSEAYWLINSIKFFNK